MLARAVCLAAHTKAGADIGGTLTPLTHTTAHILAISVMGAIEA